MTKEKELNLELEKSILELKQRSLKILKERLKTKSPYEGACDALDDCIESLDQIKSFLMCCEGNTTKEAMIEIGARISIAIGEICGAMDYYFSKGGKGFIVPPDEELFVPESEDEDFGA